MTAGEARTQGCVVHHSARLGAVPGLLKEACGPSTAQPPSHRDQQPHPLPTPPPPACTRKPAPTEAAAFGTTKENTSTATTPASLEDTTFDRSSAPSAVANRAVTDVNSENGVPSTSTPGAGARARDKEAGLRESECWCTGVNIWANCVHVRVARRGGEDARETAGMR